MANSTTQFGGFLTNVGIAQQANTAALGLPWNITHMLIGDAGGEPSQTPDPTPKPTQNALVRQVYRAQLNALYQSPADPGVLVAELVLPPETGGWWIRELALEDANGNFIAVAKPAPSYKPLLAQGSGRTQTIRMHVVFGNLANVTLKIDPSIVLATRDYVDKAREAAELYARNQLKAHVEAADPHPQYLRRADVAKDAGPLAWLGAAAGTADALVLTLKSSEAALPAYAAGQRFQFQAVATNTGAVTASINGRPAVAVKKAGTAGLVDLVGGDVRAGALYDLNYDGTYFQLGGGVSSGKAFERFSFEASVGQKAFSAPHTVGNLIVMRNGREIIDFSADGQKVTLHTACNLGDTVVILAFGAFRSVDGYTKAEVDALLRTSSGLPVGSMLPFPRDVVPTGFLEVDGSVHSIAMYPDLAAYLGGAFNKGDEKAGEFRLPDSRGEFLRGWDHTRGVDAGRGLGTNQADEYKAHTHTQQGINNVASGTGGIGALNVAGNGVDGVQTRSAGGGETRPRNIAVMWCIKAWNAPVNQGQIDVAALAAEVGKQKAVSVIGGHKGLKVSATGASSLVSVMANQLVLGSAAEAKRLTAISLSIDSSRVGAGGLDAGVLTASAWYSIWVIWGDTPGVAGLLSLSDTAPTLPAGYTHKVRIGWTRTDATANKFPLGFVQNGRDVQLLVLRDMAAGVLSQWTAIATGNFVPTTAVAVTGRVQNSNLIAAVAPNASYDPYGVAYVYLPSGNGSAAQQFRVQLESANIYGSSTASGSRISVLGWEDDL
ncbi:phage tail protein [Pseudomonas sp. zfem004]|uniref:phage tail-collar fiber domain-containing protein n=1 Tax=Pseudomonas sp. zfem004 TaxID=3078199 RepID=UPI002928B9D3|nr:phage tail protein [Pseudomonas sp. zfem004]MDU9402519.1 phage tail protein [Pseudomonas sp. zfem004]